MTKKWPPTVADPGFLVGGKVANSRGEVLTYFCRKLHENEKLDLGGLASLAADLPLNNDVFLQMKSRASLHLVVIWYLTWKYSTWTYLSHNFLMNWNVGICSFSTWHLIKISYCWSFSFKTFKWFIKLWRCFLLYRMQFYRLIITDSFIAIRLL